MNLRSSTNFALFLAACGSQSAPAEGDATSRGSSSSEALGSSEGQQSSSTTGVACDGVDAIWIGDLIVDLDRSQNAADLHCIEQVDGDLLVTGTHWASMAEFSALSRVTGRVTIEENLEMTTLTGLASLSEVGSFVEIRGNTSLGEIGALGGLRQMEGLGLYSNGSIADIAGLQGDLELLDGAETGFVIFDESALISLDGLEMIASVTASGNVNVEIREVDVLSDVAGLAALAALGANLDVTLEGAPALETFGFTASSLGNVSVREAENLSSLTFGDLQNVESLEIDTRNKLENLQGLGNLTTVSGRLTIGPCAVDTAESMLDSLAGLDDLQEVGALILAGNPVLDTLAGLPDTLMITNGTLHVRDNPSLPTSDAYAYAMATGVADTADICGNKEGEACADRGFCAGGVQ